MKGERVWTIFDGHACCPKIKGPDISYAENVEVIEKSAYDSLIRRHADIEGDCYKSLRAELAEANRKLKIATEALEMATAKREWITPENPTLRNWKDCFSILVAELFVTLSKITEKP